MGAAGPFQDKPGISVHDLAIARGGRVLFEALSFAVQSGGYAEVRGANGSGKTSLLRAIAGFLKPRAGRIAFEHIEERATALHFLGHLNALKQAASVRAHLRYWAGLLSGGDEDGALASIGLAGIADLPARALSQGQGRRLAIGRLLVAPRPVWLLDEPAAALDAAGRDMLAGLIADHRRGGGIVLAAVHEPLGVEPDQVVTVGV
ncbi:MAG: heme ABC exporter ATP-binding protein CcmA [Proteobacteria bacterium]|nr:heme ABC exporter ATP-binding protein CcmA [Pseudomonadota bacterium]